MSFLEAKKEYLERYGSHMNQAKNWRTIAIVTSIVALLMGVGFYYNATKSHLVPYVTEINAASGSVQDIRMLRPLVQNSGLSPMTIRYYIVQFINYVFGNIGSKDITKTRVNKVLAMSLKKPKAVITGYLLKHNPFLELHQRTVKVHYVLQKPDGSYTVSFTVLELADNGVAIVTTNYIATVGMVVVPPKTLSQAEVNPLGIHISYFSFTKE